MRTQTFTELENTYKETVSGLDSNDIETRKTLVTQYTNSVIVEGEWLELENLEKWANDNINEMPINSIWYGKIGYDFGLVEYFFKSKQNAELFSKVVSRIYTTYRHFNNSFLVCKSDGYDKSILYNANDVSAIVFD